MLIQRLLPIFALSVGGIVMSYAVVPDCTECFDNCADNGVLAPDCVRACSDQGCSVSYVTYDVKADRLQEAECDDEGAPIDNNADESQ